MNNCSIARSAFATSIRRYRRSWGIWLLLLVAPIGARLFIPRADGTAVAISVGGRLPLMDSAVIGVCLGLVVSTLLLPAAYIYLRSNVNRSHPWQIEEVTAASRVAITLGRYISDVAILFAALLTLTVAGCFLAWLTLPPGQLDVPRLSLALWVIAGPSLMMVAAVRTLFGSIPLLRGGLGDVAYLAVWMTTLGSPNIDSSETGFFANLADPVGFVRPLVHGAGLDDPTFSMGRAPAGAGGIPVDAMAGIASPGYLPSRGAWAVIAIMIATLAGAIWVPGRKQPRHQLFRRLSLYLEPNAVPSKPDLPTTARLSSSPFLGLLVSEFRLVGAGRLRRPLALLIALAGALMDWNSLVMPVAFLWLIFAFSQHAGRAEARNLTPIGLISPTSPWARRLAFILAGASWGILIALPAAIVSMDLATAGVAGGMATAAALLASLLAASTRASFAPRLVLLIAWYVQIAG